MRQECAEHLKVSGDESPVRMRGRQPHEASTTTKAGVELGVHAITLARGLGECKPGRGLTPANPLQFDGIVRRGSRFVEHLLDEMHKFELVQ
jgi:hypothetical protein